MRTAQLKWPLRQNLVVAALVTIDAKRRVVVDGAAAVERLEERGVLHDVHDATKTGF